MFTKKDPYVGIDFDNCRDPETGEIDEQAKKYIDRFNSYTEVSPSGEGVHIIIKGELPEGGRKKGIYEVYEAGRYFTMTGNTIRPGLGVEERQQELDQFYSEIFQDREQGQDTFHKGKEVNLTDNEIIEKAISAKNGELFSLLWNGEWEKAGDYPSQSEADLALVNLLTFWAGRDPVRIDRLFRQSGLYRNKWDDKHYADVRTYGQGTIDKAVKSSRDTYDPEGSPGGNNPKEDFKQEPKEGKTFEVFSAAELLTMDIDPMKYHLEGVLPEKGFSMLAGPFKGGKSFFIIQLALSLARGDPFLGFGTRQSRVLILSGEGGQELLRARLIKMAKEERGLENILFYIPEKNLDLADENNRADVIATCENNKVDVVVVDPLIKFNTKDENSTKEMADFINGIHDLRHSAGVAVLVAHHTRKPGKDGTNGGHEARGSSVLAGEVDSLLMLKKRDEDFTLNFTLRWAEEPDPIRLEFCKETLLFENRGQLEKGNQKISERYLSDVLEENGPCTIKTLADITGVSVNTVRVHLNKLVDQGLAQHNGSKGRNEKLWEYVPEDILG